MNAVTQLQSLGNMIHQSFGGDCLANPNLCLPNFGSDYCSIVDSVAFVSSMATPFFAANPPAAFLTHLGSRVARIIQEKNCLPSNVISYSNHTAIFLSLTNMGLNVITPPMPIERTLLARLMGVEKAREFVVNNRLATHQSSTFANRFPITYGIVSQALRFMSFGGSFQEQYEVNLRKTNQKPSSASFLSFLTGSKDQK